VVKAIRTGLVIGAVLAFLAGGFILGFPGAALTVIAVVFGIFILLRGIVRLALGLFGPGLSAAGRTLSIILGILLIAASIFVLRNLEAGLAVIGLLIGLSWIVDGIAMLVESGRGAVRGFSLVAGIISVIAGVVVLFVPVEGVAVLTIFTAVVFLVLGVLQVVGAVIVGRNR
jgi:uncharacterized membrane protein HdeD (DUF308 family)